MYKVVLARRCIIRVRGLDKLHSLYINAVPRISQVLTLAVSGDGRYLASGGRDRLINVWDCRTDNVVETFRGHQDTVSSLAFRANSLALFSGSHDRCVKVRALVTVASPRFMLLGRMPGNCSCTASCGAWLYSITVTFQTLSPVMLQ